MERRQATTKNVRVSTRKGEKKKSAFALHRNLHGSNRNPLFSLEILNERKYTRGVTAEQDRNM
jgi:hypothetical protein